MMETSYGYMKNTDINFHWYFPFSVHQHNIITDVAQFVEAKNLRQPKRPSVGE